MIRPMQQARQVILHQGEDGFWIVEVPSLPGCLSQGASREEALANIREAIELWIDTAKAEGWPVPADPMTAEVVDVSTAA